MEQKLDVSSKDVWAIEEVVLWEEWRVVGGASKLRWRKVREWRCFPKRERRRPSPHQRAIEFLFYLLPTEWWHAQAAPALLLLLCLHLPRVPTDTAEGTNVCTWERRKEARKKRSSTGRRPAKRRLPITDVGRKKSRERTFSFFLSFVSPSICLKRIFSFRASQLQTEVCRVKHRWPKIPHTNVVRPDHVRE